MKISISELTTYPANLDDELAAYSEAGFHAVELSLEKIGKYLTGRPTTVLEELLAELGLTASGAVSFAPQGPSMLLSSGAAFDRYLASLRPQLALCENLGIRVVGVGADAERWRLNVDWHPQAIRNLRTAAAVAADHDIRLAIEYLSLGEPIGPFLLDTLAKTKALVDAADHPSLGLCVDFFHHFRGGGTALELGSLSSGEIANVHVTDVKAKVRQALGDADRAMPGAGVAPVANYRDAIIATGYDGYWTLELLDPELWEQDVSVVAGEGVSAMREFSIR